MRAIYKYKLTPDELELTLPKGAKIRHVNSQRDSICLWVESDSSAIPSEVRHFEVIPTGKDIPEYPGTTLDYLGTVKMSGDSLIFHVYEIVEEVVVDKKWNGAWD